MFYSALLNAVAGPAAWAVLDAANGRLLESKNADEGATPGSTVKPIILAHLIKLGVLQPTETMPCRGHLRIGDRRLDCSHPPMAALNAAAAIAYSCNEWFAQAGARAGAEELRNALAGYGLRASVPQTVEQAQLMALGEWGVTASPRVLARAYQRLKASAPATVLDGLRMAVTHGTAQKAAPAIAGKTGTTASPDRLRTRAWFAGWSERHIIAVFLDRGRGASDAAPAAGTILRRLG